MLGTWTLEILLALVTVQLLVLFYLAYRRRSASTPESRSGSATGIDGNDPRIGCDDCGAENDPAYRYCRECAADLEGESIPGYRTHLPSERSL